ncbi:MAG: 16S rRNA (guanine(966)-N(2))-methyltransferase RsmD [Rhodospirillaceae bacterium]|nr:16S rRNA (guanine(966)-N(2))-methyltransferase RsmD [Rhodospirillaceae bacterium]
MRLVGGRLKGRRLAVPAGLQVRPTAERVREAVFDILMHRDWGRGQASAVTGAVVLDAFAGTGAMGLEALSRGAAEVWLLEREPRVLAALRANLAAIGAPANAHALLGDATRPPRAKVRADLVFLDPPYRQGLAQPALAALASAGWLGPDTLTVMETARREAVPGLDGATIVDERTYGDTRILFVTGGLPEPGSL